MKLLLDKYDFPRPGIRVLHLAPEKSLFDVLTGKNVKYDPVDIEPKNFPFCSVRKFDLCVDAAKLPSNHYDLIIHSHVMEHIPCNVSAVLFDLHRSLKPDGVHFMCIPFMGGTSAEDLGKISKEDAIAWFGQDDHVRRFGAADVQRNLGMLFKIPRKYSMLNFSSAKELDEANVPERERHGFTGSSIFPLRKNDLLLQTPETHSSSNSERGFKLFSGIFGRA
ncbi:MULTISPECIES: class I SAM-dependent methyltransferase [Ruegeria]|uniref:class I SAM-dependent methyltransferase n=2 Tax=Roseobacteraceae TaxID=2854170 RepID=UPI001357B965|nr:MULTISPECIES: class I SAM-dependent methyltransferase [Ruegeria]